jgi:hypothetical protein
MSIMETIPSEPDLIRQIADLNVRPSAIQALWGGDTQEVHITEIGRHLL